MVKSFDTSKNPASSPLTDTPTPPAQHIWLAGLGAMAKAQEQGTKAIEALVNDGLAFQRKSQAEAQQRLNEATERLTHMASDLGQQSVVRVDRLEHLFEERVAKALHRLGMPSMGDMQLLQARVDQLQEQLNQILQANGTDAPKSKAAPAKKQAAKSGLTASAKTKSQRAPVKSSSRAAD
jgi:poly(hydroxyalkanoate) granule-associated protein